MNSRGSEWHRWEPHIHTPGTILNDQFLGSDPWDEYLSRIEGLRPKVGAIAVTDYYVTDTYEAVLQHRMAGRLPDVELIFPNIEIRLDVAAKSGFVNMHLLVSPEDPDHLEETHRFLTRLQFSAYDDRFACTRADLIRLGKQADPQILEEDVALRLGATQFKVNFEQLRAQFTNSGWARKNLLIAVAGGSSDGTSGVRAAADKTVREEIEKFAHVIFSSSPAQRDFWLGKGSLGVEAVRSRYGGCKPCLHGSDAHEQTTTGQPFADRYSWVKGAIEFDAIRQACIDPEGRAYVGTEPPQSTMPSQVISQVSIIGASWAATPDLPLNAGLVAVIGARGSGKTALVDVIAAGCDAIPEEAWVNHNGISASFLARSRPLLGEAKVTVTWGGGDTATCALDGSDSNGPFSFPRVRYLSQQFVEELCSSHGASDGLVREIERVIFEAHTPEERDGALDFAELRERRTSRYRQARDREADAISDISERISTELEKENSIRSLAVQVMQGTRLIANYNADLARLVVKGTEAQAKRHAQLSDIYQRLSTRIQSIGNQKRTFQALQDEVRSMRATKAPEMLRQAQARHPASGLTADQWSDFLLVYQGDVDASLTGYVAWADDRIADLEGEAPLRGAPNVPLIAEDANLMTVKRAVVKSEMARLEALFGADKLVRDQYAALTARIARERLALKATEDRLSDANEAAARRRQLQAERNDAYGRLFEAIVAEQRALEDLYEPLMTKLASSSGTLQKLRFSVSRIADTRAWGEYAEENLLDRRKTGPFQGRGALIGCATEKLEPQWENGSAADVQAAMTDFIATYLDALLQHAPFARAQQADFRVWSKQFAHWLYSTTHIAVQYEISYDGVDIRKLSPGTRGIVLLLLYLSLDDADDRPLIIDQPEENLDPKSVYEELVSLFIAAKSKRQVIMVTHNANLVVNTDADQIVVAEAGPHADGGLPQISYQTGGLENAGIRKAVCDILEGGEEAFRERARRLRVRLER